ncbi:MAG: hypothetical protein KKA79_04780 [Nanoarchaeota archaeon]|nr:hypothetical protein [Nanoarchaeota archaeon]
MIVTPCQQYTEEKYPEYIKNAVEKYGSKQKYKKGIPLVPREGLADDVDKWLRKYEKWEWLRKIRA